MVLPALPPVPSTSYKSHKRSSRATKSEAAAALLSIGPRQSSIINRIDSATSNLSTSAPSSSTSVAFAQQLETDDKVSSENETNLVNICTSEVAEEDVLLGRGKRVSEWPGNVYFRQIINRHRDEYNKAFRSTKVEIAQRVIDGVHAIGGRFLREHIDGGSWMVVEPARAIEKACQALREKEKAKTQTSNPFSDSKKKKKLTPHVSPTLKSASSSMTSKMVKAKSCQKKKYIKWQRYLETHQLQYNDYQESTVNTNRKNDKQYNTKKRSFDGNENRVKKSYSGDCDKRTKKRVKSNLSNTAISMDDTAAISALMECRSSFTSRPDDTLTGELSQGSLSSVVPPTSNAHGHSVTQCDCFSTELPQNEIELMKDKDYVLSVALASPLLLLNMRVDSLNEDLMLAKLQEFHQRFGHAAVPIAWKDDADLALWCSVQRQVKREFSSNYRHPTPQELALLEKLERLGFVWDYDEWHWQNQLKALQLLTTKNNSNNDDDSITTNGSAMTKDTLNGGAETYNCHLNESTSLKENDRWHSASTLLEFENVLAKEQIKILEPSDSNNVSASLVCDSDQMSENSETMNDDEVNQEMGQKIAIWLQDQQRQMRDYIIVDTNEDEAKRSVQSSRLAALQKCNLFI